MLKVESIIRHKEVNCSWEEDEQVSRRPSPPKSGSIGRLDSENERLKGQTSSSVIRTEQSRPNYLPT